jgi:hypothetical protein
MQARVISIFYTCLCIPPTNCWMHGPIFMKPGMRIMATDPISTTYFINPSHHTVCMSISPVSARQRLGKHAELLDTVWRHISVRDSKIANIQGWCCGEVAGLYSGGACFESRLSWFISSWFYSITKVRMPWLWHEYACSDLLKNHSPLSSYTDGILKS